MRIKTACFKAYDIRGRVPNELNEEIAYRLGRALVEMLQAKDIVVGQDMRLESPSLAEALIQGLTDAGAHVIDIGLCGTEEIYFATLHYGTSGGVMVTASHNPKGYNGMKLVREDARPISGDTGLFDLQARIEAGIFSPVTMKGQRESRFDKSHYISHLLSYIEPATLRPLKILADPGHGMAGLIIEKLKSHLPFEWVILHGEPNGHFPNGVPNPLLPENRTFSSKAVVDHDCDLGIAWDGDFDRCFFYDSSGRFIEGYYLVGLLAKTLLKSHPGEKIIHDPRLTWNTISEVCALGGIPVQSKTGHAFIKERMRLENALYGGEMSAHHYFRSFAYCDSGMIPWLLITRLMSETGKTLAALVNEGIAAFPCSGERNYHVNSISDVMSAMENHYHQQALQVDRTDGLSFEFSDWRFNIRGSNTEPVLRLNVETKNNDILVEERVKEIESLIR